MARPNYIRSALERAECQGIVRSWYCYAPEGRRRWCVEWAGPLSTRVYSTSEAEGVADALTCAAARQVPAGASA